MGRLMENLKSAQKLWEQVQDLVPITKSSIAPLVKYMAQNKSRYISI